MIFLLAIFGCDDDGPPGPVGPVGPAIPVIQSISATGLPAAPSSSVTVQVSAQSPQELPLSYSWSVVPSTWIVISGTGTDTITLTHLYSPPI